MDFNEYQKLSRKSFVDNYKDDALRFSYLSMGLTSECGEYANKAKKVLRDDNSKITPEKREGMIDELGDVLWYLSQIAVELDIDLEDLAKRNVDKLTSRIERGKISGSGDNR